MNQVEMMKDEVAVHTALRILRLHHVSWCNWPTTTELETSPYTTGFSGVVRCQKHGVVAEVKQEARP